MTASSEAGWRAGRGAASWRGRAAVWVLAGGMLLAGLLALAFFSVPFEQARAWADRLSADGSFERLTPETFTALRGPARVGAGLALAGAVGLLLLRKRAEERLERLLSWAGGQARALPADARLLVRDGWGDRTRAARLEAGGVALLTLGAALARILFLTRPMVHDEAYTFVAFASRPWLALVTDYHLPNNHIFHSILVKLSTGLFGIEPWAVRLPAFLAGVLAIPAAYGLAKRLYGRETAWLSAGVLAALPVMILYSHNARGYSLFTLLGLLIARLAVYLKDHPNRAGWLLLALLSALGLYTVPMMAYPFGMVAAWLGLTALLEAPAPYGSRGRLLACLAGAVVLAVLLAGLLYLPVIVRGTGLHSLVGNSFVAPVPWADLPDTLRSRAQDTWQEWTLDLPGWAGLLLAGGSLLSLALHRRISRVRVPFQAAGFVAFAALILAQRPNPYARMWTFLVPFVVIWAAAGIWGFLALLFERSSAARGSAPAGLWGRIAASVLVLSLVGMGLSTWQRTLEKFPGLQPYPGEIEQVVTQVLQPRLREGDIVIISSEDAPVLWYYFRLYGISEQGVHNLEKHPFPFGRAFVVVSRQEGQTLESAIRARGLDPQSFALESATRVGQVGETEIYETMARETGAGV